VKLNFKDDSDYLLIVHGAVKSCQSQLNLAHHYIIVIIERIPVAPALWRCCRPCFEIGLLDRWRVWEETIKDLLPLCGLFTTIR